MAIVKVKQLMEDLKNNTQYALEGTVAYAGSAAKSGTTVLATSAANAGTAAVAAKGTSGSAL